MIEHATQFERRFYHWAMMNGLYGVALGITAIVLTARTIFEALRPRSAATTPFDLTSSLLFSAVVLCLVGALGVLSGSVCYGLAVRARKHLQATDAVRYQEARARINAEMEWPTRVCLRMYQRFGFDALG